MIICIYRGKSEAGGAEAPGQLHQPGRVTALYKAAAYEAAEMGDVKASLHSCFI